jgi:putative flippase GtrA
VTGVSDKTAGELARFLVVGAATVALDFVTYRALLSLGLPVDLAKAAGFVAGTAFAYFANRTITFRAAGGPAAVFRFGLAYGAGLAVNVGSNALLLHLLGMGQLAIGLAFTGATALSATSNFLTMKYFVFAGEHARGRWS